MDAFDADVLIYAALPGHALGRRVQALFTTPAVLAGEAMAGVGSVLLLPELLSKPLRERSAGQLGALATLLGRLELRPTDLATAELAVALAAEHRLRAADAIHLATAVGVGADRFVTNNSRDFPKSIPEIEITYAIDLPEP